MSLLPKPHLAAEDYLALERSADFKSEFFDGETFAITGANESHNLIVANTLAEIRQQFKKKPCKIYANDMRVKVGPSG